jgi:hypothetical protein
VENRTAGRRISNGRLGPAAKPAKDHRFPIGGQEQSGDPKSGLRSKVGSAVVAGPGCAADVETDKAKALDMFQRTTWPSLHSRQCRDALVDHLAEYYELGRKANKIRRKGE